MVLWGIERFFDEHLWLGEDGHLGSLLVQGAGILLAVAGTLLLISRIGPLRRWRRGEGGAGGDGRTDLTSDTAHADADGDAAPGARGEAASAGDPDAPAPVGSGVATPGTPDEG